MLFPGWNWFTTNTSGQDEAAMAPMNNVDATAPMSSAAYAAFAPENAAALEMPQPVDMATGLVMNLNAKLNSGFEMPAPISYLMHASATNECGDGICSPFELHRHRELWEDATTSCPTDCRMDGFCTMREATYLPWPIQPWSSMPHTSLLLDYPRREGASLVRRQRHQWCLGQCHAA